MEKPYVKTSTSISGNRTVVSITAKVGPNPTETRAAQEAIANCRGPEPDITKSLEVIDEYIKCFGENSFLHDLQVSTEELDTWRAVARAVK